MIKPTDEALDAGWKARVEAGLRITQGVMFDDLMAMPLGYVLTLQARIAQLEAAANAAYDVLAEDMENTDIDYAPASEVAIAFNLLFDALSKAPAPEVDDPSGGELPL